MRRSRITARRRAFLRNLRFIHACLSNSRAKTEVTRPLSKRSALGLGNGARHEPDTTAVSRALRHRAPWTRGARPHLPRLRFRLATGATVGSWPDGARLRFGRGDARLWCGPALPGHRPLGAPDTHPVSNPLGASQGSAAVRSPGNGSG